MSEQVVRRPPLANLTSVRFFAACYVLLYHTRGGVWFRSGFTGVTLFFVLSGFILAYNYPAIAAGARKRFYLARIARIYPLYVVSCFAMYPYEVSQMTGGHAGIYALQTASYLALIQTWIPPFHFAINAGGWTLSVEMFFYLIFPFIIAWFGRFQKNWMAAIGVLYAILLIPNLICVLLVIPAHPAWDPVVQGVLSLPIFHMGEFFIGMVLGLRFLNKQPVFRGITVLGAFALCVAMLAFAGTLSHDYERITLNGLLALPFGLLIYSVAGWKSRVMAHPILQLGGEISFSIYLLQFVIVDLVQRLFHHYRGMVALRFLLFLVGAFISYEVIEKPCRRWLLHVFGIKSHPKPIETPDPATP
jgi:peptidoglycan/LPS O-acetylase OafA/YrhL